MERKSKMTEKLIEYQKIKEDLAEYDFTSDELILYIQSQRKQAKLELLTEFKIKFFGEHSYSIWNYKETLKDYIKTKEVFLK